MTGYTSKRNLHRTTARHKDLPTAHTRDYESWSRDQQYDMRSSITFLATANVSSSEQPRKHASLCLYSPPSIFFADMAPYARMSRVMKASSNTEARGLGLVSPSQKSVPTLVPSRVFSKGHYHHATHVEIRHGPQGTYARSSQRFLGFRLGATKEI